MSRTHLETKQGLVTEMSAEGRNDSEIIDILLSSPEVTDAEVISLGFEPTLSLIMLKHLEIPPMGILPHDSVNTWIREYRRYLISIAKDAGKRLNEGGMLIMGVKDVRVMSSEPDSTTMGPSMVPQTKLVPLAALVLDDIAKSIDESVLRLREFVVCVPDHYSLDRNIDPDVMQGEVDREDKQWSMETSFESQFTSFSQNPEEIHTIRRALPIVHVCYLIYMKPYKKGGSVPKGDEDLNFGSTSDNNVMDLSL